MSAVRTKVKLEEWQDPYERCAGIAVHTARRSPCVIQRREDQREQGEGRMGDHQRFLLRELLDQVEEAERRIGRYQAQSEDLVEQHFAQAVA